MSRRGSPSRRAVPRGDIDTADGRAARARSRLGPLLTLLETSCAGSLSILHSSSPDAQRIERLWWLLLLYAWPFLEARVTEDHETHHLLDRPSARPARTAIGIAAVAFYGLLMLANSDDVLALVTNAQITQVVWGLRAAVILTPPLAGWATYMILREGERGPSPVVSTRFEAGTDLRMKDDLEPALPEEEGVEDETPELAQIEPARKLANDARDRLEAEGFTEKQIRHWAETYVAQEGGSADVEDFIDWISDQES